MRIITSLLILAALLAPTFSATAPDVNEILRKVVANSENPDLVHRKNRIAYQRTSRIEYLNNDGTRKRDVVRVFKITPENGKTVTRLISVNGRPPTNKAGKRKSAARETGEKGRTLTLTDDLVSRFDFTFIREDQFASRPAWVLSFVPKANVASDSLLDRLINAVSGTLWIDQEDYQLAKADLRLGKRVSFFGGMAGAIEKMNLTLIQKRIESSVWLGEALQIDFVGRKLFSEIRFKCFENCSNFAVLPGEQARSE